MNNYLEVKGLINKEKLSKDNFFLSLLEELSRKKIFSFEEVQFVQMQVVGILKEEVEYYTRRESSSIRIEVAEELLLSIYYTIGIFLKGINNIDECIDILKCVNSKELFKSGRKVLEGSILKALKIRESVNKNMITTKNYAYNDTLGYGIDLFFKEYDSRFSAHNTPGSIDYPLFDDKMELVGVEYIISYLSKIDMENKYCSNFNNEDIESLLDSYDNECEQLLINIFSMVLTNSIGSILCGKDAKNLYITKSEIEYIKSNLQGKTDCELKVIIEKACIESVVKLNITEEEVVEYVMNACDFIYTRIRDSITLNKLETVFIANTEVDKNKFVYIDSESISNDDFKKVTERIRDTSDVKEKIRILNKEITSLEDLVDVLGADCIFDDELIEVFDSFENMKIALLLKYSKIPINVTDYDEFEKEWYDVAYTYVYNTNEEKRLDILNKYNKIDM